jgi:formylglycine-generating enzyme required for sulfatase activity
MSLFDWVFWLLILLIAVLAYCIESGLSARHRALILSSILSATVAAIFMMFLIEDHSSFGTGDPMAQEEKNKKVGGGGLRVGSGGGVTEIDEAAPADGDGSEKTIKVNPYEDSELLAQPGGFRDCPECPLMIMVEKGHFMIGSPELEAGRRANEGPMKQVSIKRAFTVSRYEILIQEFEAFVQDTGHVPSPVCMVNGQERHDMGWLNPGFVQPTGDRPVVCINRDDAEAYAAWLTQKTKRTYRLLSEAEWEYVARAGTKTPFWTGNKMTAEQAHFGLPDPGTIRAGRFEPNAFKVFDTAGNVWEMTADCWADDLEKISAFGGPVEGDADCARHPVRGGGWEVGENQLRSAYRRSIPRDQAFNTVGLRIARELK